jgi:phosphoserine phosphatase
MTASANNIENSIMLSPKYENDKLKFLSSLKKIDYAIFDFDGTIYPNLFLFDLAKQIFDKYADNKRLKELNAIAGLYIKGDFNAAFLKFLDILKGEDRTEFQDNSRILIKKSYKYSKLVIAKLKREYGIKSYLISLTADFISEIIEENFDFEKTFSMNYAFDKNDSREEFNGKTLAYPKKPQEIKLEMLAKIIKANSSNNYINFFDSTDDILIAKKAMLRVEINPKPDLSNYTDFDIILKNKKDPWKELYMIL